MCTIIAALPNTSLPKRVLKHTFANNSHGAGVSYVENGKLVIKKGFFTFGELWKVYKEIPKNRSILLHFRLSTGSNISKHNCHPYKLSDKVIFCHNGSMKSLVPENEKIKSDTRILAEKLKPIFHGEYKCSEVYKLDSFKWFFTQCFGKENNKFVFMGLKDGVGQYSIVNEDKGEWIDDFGGKFWASNSYWREDRPVKKANATSESNNENIIDVDFKNHEQSRQLLLGYSDYDRGFDGYDDYTTNCDCGGYCWKCLARASENEPQDDYADNLWFKEEGETLDFKTCFNCKVQTSEYKEEYGCYYCDVCHFKFFGEMVQSGGLPNKSTDWTPGGNNKKSTKQKQKVLIGISDSY